MHYIFHRLLLITYFEGWFTKLKQMPLNQSEAVAGNSQMTCSKLTSKVAFNWAIQI